MSFEVMTHGRLRVTLRRPLTKWKTQACCKAPAAYNEYANEGFAIHIKIFNDGHFIAKFPKCYG